MEILVFFFLSNTKKSKVESNKLQPFFLKIHQNNYPPNFCSSLRCCLQFLLQCFILYTRKKMVYTIKEFIHLYSVVTSADVENFYRYILYKWNYLISFFISFVVFCFMKIFHCGSSLHLLWLLN